MLNLKTRHKGLEEVNGKNSHLLNFFHICVFESTFLHNTISSDNVFSPVLILKHSMEIYWYYFILI